jgi:hypothetical protein
MTLDLDKLKALCDAAAPSREFMASELEAALFSYEMRNPGMPWAGYTLALSKQLAAARTALPELIAEVERLGLAQGWAASKAMLSQR